MGKGKKKGKKNGEMFSDMDMTFTDPAALDAFIAQLAAEGEFNTSPSVSGNIPQFGKRSISSVTPPSIPSQAMTPQPPYIEEVPSLRNVPRQQPASVLGTKPVGKIPRQASEPQNSNRSSNSVTIQVAGYGRLRFDILENAYGRSLVFSDSFGNAVARPIYMRGISSEDDAADEYLQKSQPTELYEAVLVVYQLIKMRMYPDAIFPLNPDGAKKFSDIMEIIDTDHIYNFMSNSGVTSYIMNIAYVNDIVAPKIVNLIKSVGGNVLFTLDNFVPRQDYPDDTFRVFIDAQIVDGDQTDVAIEKYEEYTRKYCRFQDNHREKIDDIGDVLSDFDSIYGGLVNEFESIISSAIDEVSGDEQIGTTPESVMVDPNLEALQRAAAQTEYTGNPLGTGGVSNDDIPFPDDGQNITIHTRTDTTITVTDGRDCDEDNRVDESISANEGDSIEVSATDVTASGNVHTGDNTNGSNRGSVSPSCTTVIGDILKNTFKETEEEKGAGGDTSGVHASETGGKTAEKGSVGIQPSGQVDKREEKQEEKEKTNGNMVIEVTTCGR